VQVRLAKDVEVEVARRAIEEDTSAAAIVAEVLRREFGIDERPRPVRAVKSLAERYDGSAQEAPRHRARVLS